MENYLFDVSWAQVLYGIYSTVNVCQILATIYLCWSVYITDFVIYYLLIKYAIVL